MGRRRNSNYEPDKIQTGKTSNVPRRKNGKVQIDFFVDITASVPIKAITLCYFNISNVVQYYLTAVIW